MVSGPTSNVFGNACMAFGHAGVITWCIGLAFTRGPHQTHSVIVRSLQQQVDLLHLGTLWVQGILLGQGLDLGAEQRYKVPWEKDQIDLKRLPI